MALNWVHMEDFSFDCLLLMERFQIRSMLAQSGNEAWRGNMAIALHAHPSVRWYLTQRCPERAATIETIAAEAPQGLDPQEIRRAELGTLASIEDFVIYTRPELMDTHCDFIYGWNKERLFELADFASKIVLDVGSGSGRLAFAAAQRAREVYASEPVSTLREYLRDNIAREGIQNVRVVDGMAHSLPYPNDTFDIVMSGHVVGDDYDTEIAELTRVVKSGGWLLDCPGEESRKRNPDGEMIKRGWQQLHYTSSLGGDVYRYRMQACK